MDQTQQLAPSVPRRRMTGFVVALVGLLFCAVEVLIVRSYVDSSRMTSVFATTVESTTFAANVQREFFLYQRTLLDTPMNHWEGGKTAKRRSFLTRQIELLAGLGQSKQFASNLDAIRYKLSSINGLVRDPSLIGEEEEVKAELKHRLSELELKLKRAFDAEETLLYGSIADTIRAREQSQRFLIPLGGLVFIVTALISAVWSRSVRSKLTNAYNALVAEMEERKSLQDELAHQATHDSLTGLANRELLRNDLEKALGRVARKPESAVGLLYLDLDSFKRVNDTFGHEAGDKLLKAVAERIRSSIRPADTSARLGGDEFAILVDDVGTPDEVVGVAKRLLTGLADIPRPVDSPPVRASIGVALSESGTVSVDDLLREADYAMYEAKQSGGGYRVFDPEIKGRAMRADALEQELRDAISQHQLVLHYQPLVALDSGRILGLEALVRWDHPTRGLLPPGEFIELAEERGLIVDLDRWVLNESCLQLARWKKDDPQFGPLYVAVNISATHFEDSSLVSDVRKALRRSGLQPRDLRIEVTESTLMRDKDAAAATLKRLSELGVSLSLDDFGTGYSSLSYLRSFPLDTLKIDRVFVDGVATRPDDAALSKAIIELGHMLNLEVVAEGIEGPEQVSELNRLGCRVGQGYLFSKPQPPEAIETMIASNDCFDTGGAGESVSVMTDHAGSGSDKYRNLRVGIPSAAHT